MKLIAERLNRFQPSLTVEISQKARELRAKGIEIVSLSSGEPDFDTPQHIKNHAIESINEGFTKYTQVDGILELKKSIRKKFMKENRLKYEIDQITVGVGGKHVIYNLFMSTLNKGDEVIIPAPYWVSYPDIVSLCNGKPIIVKTQIENGFKITPSQLEEKISPRTKWFVLNSPCNPTGSIYTSGELRKLSEILSKFENVGILSDDIYEHIIYNNRKFCNILNEAPDLYKRTFIVNGVSKAFSMTGWRIGYGAGTKELIKSISKVQTQSTTNPCSISQKAALFALESEKNFLQDWIKQFDERKNFLIDFFSSQKHFLPFEPDGAFYLYISCRGFIGKKFGEKLIRNDIDFSNFLLEQARVAVVPGVAFGMSPYFRISYATSMENLLKATEQIQKAVKHIK